MARNNIKTLKASTAQQKYNSQKQQNESRERTEIKMLGAKKLSVGPSGSSSSSNLPPPPPEKASLSRLMWKKAVLRLPFKLRGSCLQCRGRPEVGGEGKGILLLLLWSVRAVCSEQPLIVPLSLPSNSASVALTSAGGSLVGRANE